MIGVAATAALGYSTNELTEEAEMVVGHLRRSCAGTNRGWPMGPRGHRKAKQSACTAVERAVHGVAQQHTGGVQQAAGHDGTKVVSPPTTKG